MTFDRLTIRDCANITSFIKAKEKEMILTPTTPTPNVNFNRKVVEDIKHVYGVPVSQLSLNGITGILTDRQLEVERLESIPHKPQAIKQQIADIKAQIKELLELADELFPVES